MRNKSKFYRYRVGVFGLLLWFIGNIKSSGQYHISPDLPIDSLIGQSLANAQAYDLLKQATQQIGHRLSGSENGRKAEEFVYHTLKARGLKEVEYLPFSFNTWKRGSCLLEIVPYKSDNYVPIAAEALANTPPADGIWHLVDVGDGLKADFEQKKEQVKGKCVLVNLGLSKTDSGRKNLHRAEKVALAIAYGATSVLFAHQSPGKTLLTGTANLKGEQVSIPALCISGNSASIIREWLKKERLMAEMKVKSEVAPATARCVSAFISAGKKTKETILLTAHLDSWDLATGAADNGLGSFALLDIAANLQGMAGKLNRNVRLIWTMGEEQGVLGSKAWLKKLKSENKLKDIRVVVNLDMVASPDGINDFGWPGSQSWVQDFNAELKKSASWYKGQIQHAAWLHSDHEPFMLEGTPVICATSTLSNEINECYHANCDNINLIKREYLEHSAIFHTCLVARLGSSKKLPFSHMNEKQVEKWLGDNGLKEKLKISGEWKGK